MKKLQAAATNESRRTFLARSGVIEFQQADPHTVKLSLPLEINDFVKLYFR